jgi:CNT family concentrative nucleoside transporter
MQRMLILQGVLGIVFFLIVSWLLSENRRAVNIKAVLGGVLLQVSLAILILKIEFFQQCLIRASKAINLLKDATLVGTEFIFGYLGGAAAPFVLDQSAIDQGASMFIFAFQPLPMIMVVSAISMLLFHWRILPIIVKSFSWALRKTLGIGGALGVVSAAKIFLGQTEAPLLIRPYLNKFSRSELFTVMTAGMATTSATIMVLYATILEHTIANPISHILTASIISIPAAITLSRIMIPHTGDPTSGDMVLPYKFSGTMDAVSQGATDGMRLFINIIAMLIVTLALVAFINKIIVFFTLSPNWGFLPTFMGEPITLERFLGFIMAPLTWLMGIPWSEATTAGNLLGTKTILNEVVAFIGLSALPKGELSPHSNLIMTYALCGFANLSSIGIQIGGIGTMIPERRTGTFSSCMSGTIVGLIWWWG